MEIPMVRDRAAAAAERWFFYQDIANLWKWARLDLFGTVLAYSGSAFATREACVDDARRSGYRGEIRSASPGLMRHPAESVTARTQFQGF
jgi:hypothetical protein